MMIDIFRLQGSDYLANAPENFLLLVSSKVMDNRDVGTGIPRSVAEAMIDFCHASSSGVMQVYKWALFGV